MCYAYVVSSYKILLACVAGHMGKTAAVERLSTAESRFLNLSRRAGVSALSFTDSDGVRCYDRAWRRKATNIVWGGKGM